MEELIEAWDPTKTALPEFVTDEQQSKNQGSSDYFLDSADRVHFFLEKGTTGSDGKLKPEVKKTRALNKVGHGLHVMDDVFKAYSQSAKVIDLVDELGSQEPVLPQSMYIFKQPTIGGEVTSHQDSTFLYTTPRQTCLGLWLALDAATTENGCIWARPGSHIEPVRRHFVRNPAHFEGDKSQPQMIFIDNCGEGTGHHLEWEGKMPSGWEPPSKGLEEKGFKAVECEVGDLIVIHGQVDHLSLPNTSGKTRDTFQLHLVDGPGAGITWSPKNWLQYPAGKTFPSLANPGKRKFADVADDRGEA
jgi:phytanoyl-CoA hydroxylase